MQPAPLEPAAAVRRAIVLRLLVRNHAGVMSHVCGLFARRAFNVEGILCVPVGDATRSVVLLLVNDDRRLDQLVRQLSKLDDVLEIHHDQRGATAFASVARDIERVGLADATPADSGSDRSVTPRS